MVFKRLSAADNNATRTKRQSEPGKRGRKAKPVVEFPVALLADWTDVPAFREALVMHAARHGDSICHLHKALTAQGEKIERSILLK